MSSNHTATAATASSPSHRPINNTTTAAIHGESQRVYWQQWFSNNETSTGSRREWMTSSVAIRMTHNATALDCTNLLRQSLGLLMSNNNSNTHTHPDDALVLVGTLYSLSRDFVTYQHATDSTTARVISRGGGIPQPETPLSTNATGQSSPFNTTTNHRRMMNVRRTPPRTTKGNYQQNTNNSTTTTTTTTTSLPSTTGESSTTSSSSSSNRTRSDPFHLIYTLEANESPLHVRQRMAARIRQLEDKAIAWNGGRGRHIMSATAPQIQWYFIPGIMTNDSNTTTNNDETNRPSSSEEAKNKNNHNNNTAPPPPPSRNSNIPNCLNLEGYCTSMEEDEGYSSSDDDDDEDGDGNDDDSVDSPAEKNHMGDNKDLLLAKPIPMHKKQSFMNYDDDDDDNNHDNHHDNHQDVDAKENRIRVDRDFSSLQEKMEARFPWLKEQQQHSHVTKTPDDTQPSENPLTSIPFVERYPRFAKKLARERRRGNALTVSCRQQPQQSHYLSGFLLKRCHKDRHVWRKVHCVLTHNYLWFVTRVYTKELQSDNSSYTIPYSKHGRIRLTQALLLEPGADYAPLSRTPYALELMTPDGNSHAFRATSKYAQIQWIRVLQERIVMSYENSLLEQAELIMVDESRARSKRMESGLNVDQLTKKKIHDLTSTASRGPFHYSSHHDRMHIRSPCLVEWGLMVTEYREFGRYVHSVLPAKSPVRAEDATVAAIAALSLESPPQSPYVKGLIQHCWAKASRLLLMFSAGPPKKFQVVQMEGGNDSTAHVPVFAYPRRLETLFRHIEYVITGRHAGATSVASSSSTTTSRRQSLEKKDKMVPAHQILPPPLDLFDQVLAELQAMVVVDD